MQIVGLSVEPGAPGSGSTLWGTVMLDAAAGEAGVTIQLASDQPEVAAVAPQLELRMGATAGQFPILVKPAREAVAVRISARLDQTELVTTAVVPAAAAELVAIGAPADPTSSPPSQTALAPRDAEEEVHLVSTPPTTVPADQPRLWPAGVPTNGAVRHVMVPAETPPSGPAGLLWRGVVDRLHGLIAGLVIAGPLAPTLAAMLSVGLYLSPVAGLDGLAPVTLAVLYLVLTWLVAALLIVVLGFTSPDRASMGTFGELMAQVQELSAWATWSEQQTAPPRPSMSYTTWQVARAELVAQVRALAAESRQRGARWVLATGYMTLWRRLHRAQEALIEVAPPEAVIKYAQFDLLRVNNATMARSDSYVSLLADAIKVLSQGRHIDASLDQLIGDLTAILGALGSGGTPTVDAVQLLDARSDAAVLQLRALPTPVNAAQLAETLAAAKGKFGDASLDVAALRKAIQTGLQFLQALSASVADQAGGTMPASGLTPPRSVTEATALVRTIRRMINDFRDDSRAGLVRARNQLLGTTGITAMTAYGLLWVALLGRAPATAVTAAISYYLVGAIVGLFTRLYAEANTETGVDDFGLSMTRLLAAPLLSGLAGVLGIVLLGMAAATQYQQQTSALADAFDLARTPLNLVTAGVFGLTPGLLIDHLTQKTDQYKQDLKSSQATTSTTKPS